MIEKALQAAITEKDAWHVEHQGPLDAIWAHVWWCGDDWCDCTQAQIVARFRNLFDSRFVVPRVLWQGTFYTDGESGADDELTAKRAEIEATEPEIMDRMTWAEMAHG